GELEAMNSVKIMGPTGMRAARIWETKINKLIPEGKVVKKGDFIASLDQSGLRDKIQEAETNVTKAQAQYDQAVLDSTLKLREARDKLINLKYAVEEKKIVLEQSQFEPPATIKQANIEVEKADRAFSQATKNYQVQVDQAIAKVREVSAELSKESRDLSFMLELQKGFTITAPEDGMIIYEREWNGQKKKEGSNLQAWNPTVATLPDLTKMVSKTYVNEVDIRKIKIGQTVGIGLDAFPDKQLTGVVKNVANVGEQKPNSDAKVFEVSIKINEADTTLRPSMTTSNAIQADLIKDVVFLPLEALFTQGDSVSYVFKKEGNGFIKQQVMTGKSNETSVIIDKGIAVGETVSIARIDGMEEEDVVMLEGESVNDTAENRKKRKE
ncbi:MAG: HlyD family secretion protein, partial [Bacteroidia bacterium]